MNNKISYLVSIGFAFALQASGELTRDYVVGSRVYTVPPLVGYAPPAAQIQSAAGPAQHIQAANLQPTVAAFSSLAFQIQPGQAPRFATESIMPMNIHAGVNSKAVTALCSYGNALYAGFADGQIRKWIFSQGQGQICELAGSWGPVSPSSINHIIFYTHRVAEPLVITGSQDGLVTLLDLPRNLQYVLHRQEKPVSALCFQYTCPYQLYCADTDGHVHQIDMRKKQKVSSYNFESPVHSMVALPQDVREHDRVAVGLANGCLVIFDFDSYTPKKYMLDNRPLTNIYHDPAHPNFILVTSLSGKSWLVNINSGEGKLVEAAGSHTLLVARQQVGNSYAQITSDKRIFIKKSDHAVSKELSDVVPGAKSVLTACFLAHPYAQLLALGLSDSTIKVIDWRNNTRLYDIDLMRGNAATVPLLPAVGLV